MKLRNTLIISVIAIVLLIFIEYYLKKITTGDFRELLDFMAGFFFGVGIILPIQQIIKRLKSK